MATSSARAHWEGDLTSGSGVVSTSSAAIDSARLTWKARTGGEPGTTPEELLGAAHAACFSMALSNMLASAGHTARTIDVDAQVDFGPGDDGNSVRSITLELAADVPGIDRDAFELIADEAKRSCPISRALSPSLTVELQAQLAHQVT